jgi:dTDP-4-amino-4,6-dideoxygalactose transaminase
MYKNEGGWYYEQLELGYNYRITDVQCALGISQLRKIDMFVKRRREIAAIYDEAFQGMDEVLTPYQSPNGINSYHLYIIQVDKSIRRQVFSDLHEAGIGVNVHYIPVYKHPYYQRIGYEDTICPNAENLYEGLISLPMYYSLSDSEVEYVVDAVKKLVRRVLLLT